MAAHRGGIKEIIIPLENEKDLQEVPATILREVKIKTVEHMDEVLRQALLLPDPEAFLVKRESDLQESALYPTEPPKSAFRGNCCSLRKVIDR